MGKNKTTRHITPKKFVLVVYDIVATVTAALFSLFIYYEGTIPGKIIEYFKNSWFIYPLVGFIIFYLLGFFDQMWAFASTTEYVIVATGALVHTVAMVLILQLLELRFAYVAYILYWFILTLILLLIRISYRWYSHFLYKQRQKKTVSESQSIRVLIVGGGRAGSQIISELHNRQVIRVPVAIVDDNPLTHTYKNQGVPVLGDRDDIPKLVTDLNIDEIIIAIPSASRAAIRKIIEISRHTPARIKMLPYFSGVLEDNISVQLSDIREVDIEDLLGREPVELELEGIAAYLKDKSVLVTGGGGSIGSEIARQIARFKPRVLILFDIYENNVYELQQELTAKYGHNLNLVVLIGSVRDSERLEEIFSIWSPSVIFHAAAHKHVPLMQDSPEDAVKNNLFGTYNVGKIAGEHGAKKMVLISTDKAVNPTNTMGATKRLSEMVMLSLNNQYPKTSYSAVRFGNVLGSSGSVIPLFKKQIEKEHRVTVTHPEIERYFMTIPEASRLVLQAGSYAQDGDIFVLDMGEPVKILDLAKELITLSGYEPDVDIPIQFVGLRPGEKMYEELYLDEESLDKTAHEKIFTLHQNDDCAALKQEVSHLLDIIKLKSPQLIAKVNKLMSETIYYINEDGNCQLNIEGND